MSKFTKCNAYPLVLLTVSIFTFDILELFNFEVSFVKKMAASMKEKHDNVEISLESLKKVK